MSVEEKQKNLDVVGYNQMLCDVKYILKRGLSKAYKAVDNLKVQTYWQIGEKNCQRRIR